MTGTMGQTPLRRAKGGICTQKLQKSRSFPGNSRHRKKGNPAGKKRCFSGGIYPQQSFAHAKKGLLHIVLYSSPCGEK